ncbi:recombinase family protein [Parasphingopyxis lamellibrachiae]|uniref:DNA invertase Pin-like site-specific DNA recombinase n=1 Tax=Parasphingopyxis lamellibrachiae TaxID=680125 RepID=A0A3D9F721_9SPHN|nr:recombinase family protein [Parasphingopyxis lamellibrachiae]RED11400.1 DNA invertase Pin-like site-specific DNA recombinase [Parasphingopyxis lamellibrachiae]
MAERKRCAIYTRKSTEEGLEQDFNSLDAQREACAAYILSQAAEGWEQVDEHYDDGGWSGGSMERPALKQLLADVEARKIDIIVVYKVDRLTRSLADFAKIVDILDEREASFVSVTQAFNTTNSMGRLTLNILLSFAQFEREVTGERIRDKIAASKKKGMWMGGPVPIGYRLEERHLIVAPEEAKTVRMIFERYRELRSISRLVDELAGQGVKTKERTYRNGKIVGGIPFAKGSLAHLLKNPVYTGKVHHKGNLFDGMHEAIVDQALWSEVRSIFTANGADRKLGKKSHNPSLLTGMLTDPDGRPMTPVHGCRGPKRYRYYVTRYATGEISSDPWRVPAAELDRLATQLIRNWLRRSRKPGLAEEMAETEQLASAFADLPLVEKRRVLLERRLRFRLLENAITISAEGDSPANQLSLPAQMVRRGCETKLSLPPDDRPVSAPDPVLLKLLAQAHAAQQMVIDGHAAPNIERYSKGHISRLLRISWLAPDIVSAIVEGRQPKVLTGRRLLRAAGLPMDWADQRKFLGFG